MEAAFDRERRPPKPIVLFPIQIDGAVAETSRAWVAEIHRTRHVGDFRNWKSEDFYQQAFNRLLRDLKASF